MKKLLLILALSISLFGEYYELEGGIKVLEFNPKGDDSKLCVAVKLFGEDVSISCFEKKK